MRMRRFLLPPLQRERNSFVGELERSVHKAMQAAFVQGYMTGAYALAADEISLDDVDGALGAAHAAAAESRAFVVTELEQTRGDESGHPGYHRTRGGEEWVGEPDATRMDENDWYRIEWALRSKRDQLGHDTIRGMGVQTTLERVAAVRAASQEKPE